MKECLTSSLLKATFVDFLKYSCIHSGPILQLAIGVNITKIYTPANTCILVLAMRLLEAEIAADIIIIVYHNHLTSKHTACPRSLVQPS